MCIVQQKLKSVEVLKSVDGVRGDGGRGGDMCRPPLAETFSASTLSQGGNGRITRYRFTGFSRFLVITSPWTQSGSDKVGCVRHKSSKYWTKLHNFDAKYTT